MAVTINGTTGIAGVDGSASTPAVQGTDTNTGIFFPAADTIAFGEGGAEVARFDSSGNLGIGTTSPSSYTALYSNPTLVVGGTASSGGSGIAILTATNGSGTLAFADGTTGGEQYRGYVQYNHTSDFLRFGTTETERARIASDGSLIINSTSNATSSTDGKWYYFPGGEMYVARNAGIVSYFNRNTDDGTIIEFRQANTTEGTISVSGTTVSYNGGNLSRWAQMPGTKDDTLVKGTVMSNLDEMNVYTDAEGNPVDNEQLNKVKVSDVEGDVNVAGVFVNWTYDDAHQVDEINMAMTGDMIIRIAQGVTVQKGDFLMYAGDGTAKPQGDDIVRSKTVAKVTSNHVTCTYADGSYCVPCVLMAC